MADAKRKATVDQARLHVIATLGVCVDASFACEQVAFH